MATTPPPGPPDSSPPRPPASPPSNALGGALGKLDATEPGELVKQATGAAAKLSHAFFRRVTRSDFYVQRAMAEERAALSSATPPVTDELAQDYAAWRRAVLWPAGVLLAIAAVFAIVDIVELADGAMFDEMVSQQGVPRDYADSLQTVWIWLSVGPMICIAVASGLVFWAATQWNKLDRSVKVSRFAWVVAFLLPILWMLIPFTTMLDYESIESAVFDQAKQELEAQAGFTAGQAQQQWQEAAAMAQWNGQPVPERPQLPGEDDMRAQARELSEQAVKQAQDFTSISMAFIVLVAFGPKVIGLFPGIVRSCLTLKTLLPQSSAPGWVAILVAPFYALFFAVVLIAAIQSDYSWLLSLALLFMTLAPLIIILRWRGVADPTSPEEAHRRIKSIRALTAVLTTIGIVFFAVLMISKIVDEALTIGQALSFIIGIVGNLLLVQVVVSDLMLGMIRRAFDEGRSFAGTELSDDLGDRFERLGLGGEAPPATVPAP